MGTATDTKQAQSPVPENDWPEFIESPVFLRYEDGQYIAVVEKFSIIGIGDTPAEAWKQADEHACSYLDLCHAQRLPYRNVLRPLPLSERLRHRGMIALIAVVRAVRRQPRHERKTEFIHPHTRDGLAHAAC